jgi:acetyl esterase/lipase
VATTPDDPSFAGPELWSDVSDHVDGFIGFYGYYDGMQFEADAYYGAGATTPEEADSVDHAGEVLGWTVLVHSTADQIVDVAASAAFAHALAEAGEEVVYLQTDDAAGHGFDGDGRTSLTAAGRAIAWRLESLIEAADTGDAT